MNTAQQTALEALAGRVLTAPEVATLTPLVAARSDGLIAAALSLNADGTPRKKLEQLEITERGVRAILGDVEGARFVRVMRELAAAAATDTVPAWLSQILTAIGRAPDTHVLTLDTMGIARGWLEKAPGLDIGDPATQGLLDLIAMGYPTQQPMIAQACATLKARALVEDPVSVSQVSTALNNIGA